MAHSRGSTVAPCEQRRFFRLSIGKSNLLGSTIAARSGLWQYRQVRLRQNPNSNMVRQYRLRLFFIWVLAISARLALIAYHNADIGAFESGDYALYRIGGEHIREYGDLTNSLFLLRPPLFPLLIAALKLDHIAILMVNALIGSTLVPLTAILAHQLGLSSRLALGAALITALDPASIVYSSFLGPEPLANAALACMAIALLQAVVYTRGPSSLAWGTVAGAALVLSVLARPAPYLLWIPLTTWALIVYRKQLLAIGIYALVAVIGIGSWVIHNGQVFDNYTVSTVGAYSMLYYRAASVERWATGNNIEDVYIELSRRVEKRMGRDPSQVDVNTRHHHYTGPSELTRVMTAVAIDVYTDHPLYYFATIPVGLARMYGWTNLLPVWSRLPEVLWNIMFVAASAVGLWCSWRRRHWLLLCYTGLFGLYFTVGTMVSQTSGLDTRMRTMLVPFMAILSVYGICSLRKKSNEFGRMDSRALEIMTTPPSSFKNGSDFA